MTTEQLTALVAAIPFCAHLQLGPSDDGGLALPDEPPLRNHYGTAHAGALYTLGEAASGLAILRALPELAAAPLLVAKTAHIDYKKPAHGRVTARGSLREPPEAIRARVQADGKATIDVDVSLRDADALEVATMVVTWYARG